MPSMQMLLCWTSGQVGCTVTILSVSDLPAWFAMEPIAPYAKTKEPVVITGFKGRNIHTLCQVFEWRSPVDSRNLANVADIEIGFKQLCDRVGPDKIDMIQIRGNFHNHVAWIFPAASAVDDTCPTSAPCPVPAPA